MTYRIIAKSQSWRYTCWSLLPESELESRRSGSRGVDQSNQVGIKIDIQTEEVQSKLLV